jgi:putative phage-type endonuclease
VTAPIGYYEGIGGSVCAAIMGLDPHKTPYDAWLNFVDPSTREDISDEEPIIWGNVLEKPVGLEAARRLGIEVVHQPDLVKHPRLPFMQAHVDFLVTNDDAGLECKNRGLFMLRQYDLADGVEVEDQVLPTEALQVHHYMTVTGRKRWYLAVLVGGQKLLTFKFERDEAMCSRIEAACEEFWGYVQRGEPPPPINVEDCHKLWGAHAPGKIIEVQDDFAQVAELRATLKAELKRIDEELSFIDFRIKSTMQDAEEMRIGRRPIFTWKKNKDGLALNTAKLREEYPDVVAACMEPSEGARVLRAKKL